MIDLQPGVSYKAKYRLTGEDCGYQIQFFCAMCGRHYTTGWISAGSETEARMLAEKEARRSFNGCRKCGCWICDEHYNMSEMMCVRCAPKEQVK